jgi:hypothetical protein
MRLRKSAHGVTAVQISGKPQDLQKRVRGVKMCVSFFFAASFRNIFHSETYLKITLEICVKARAGLKEVSIISVQF